MELVPTIRRPPVMPTVQSVTIGAPIGGLNTVDAGPSMPATDAVAVYNLIGAELGLRSRLGYREWCTGFDGPVLSVLPFTGSQTGKNRLFATTSTGIWDCSDSTQTPTRVLAFPDGTQGAGIGAFTVFVNSGGNHYGIYTDETNGYFVYNESNTTWSAVTYGSGAGQINGTKPDGVTPLDPTKLCHVTVWANRVWFVEKNSGYAWYTGTGALFGTLQPFSFGGRFRAGGDLRGLFNWTIDGGSGSTNSLVAISGGGDVAIYQGTDPSSAASFGLRGTWFVGGVPKGRRIATDFGGDLLILSSVGVVALSTLTIGNPVIDRSQYATRKIANLFNQLAYTNKDLDGWTIRLHPQDNAMIVNVPQQSGITIQLVMSLVTKGWSQYRDLPNITSAESYGGTLYFGTDDNRLCISDGYVDGITLANPSSYAPIQFSLISAFNNLGTARKKIVSEIRPTFLAQGGTPTYTIQARFGYDFTEIPALTAFPNIPDGTLTSFSLARALGPSDQIYVERMLQIYGVDYTISGNILTFLPGSIPASGATISAYYTSDDAVQYVPLGTGGSGWDYALWDQATWAGDSTPSEMPTGGTGCGQNVGIALRGLANSRTSLVQFDVLFTVGGFL